MKDHDSVAEYTRQLIDLQARLGFDTESRERIECNGKTHVVHHDVAAQIVGLQDENARLLAQIATANSALHQEYAEVARLCTALLEWKTECAVLSMHDDGGSQIMRAHYANIESRITGILEAR